MGQRLFVGLVYEIFGAAAIDAPVLHPERDPQGNVVLRLGAWQGAWVGWGDNPEGRLRIDRPELRAVFCARGILGELDPAVTPFP